MAFRIDAEHARAQLVVTRIQDLPDQLVGRFERRIDAFQAEGTAVESRTLFWILALLFARDDWHIVLGVLGYLGALLTAIYTFRMIFRAFYGEPNEEARELEHGHLFHAEHPTNPMTGEIASQAAAATIAS